MAKRWTWWIAGLISLGACLIVAWFLRPSPPLPRAPTPSPPKPSLDEISLKHLGKRQRIEVNQIHRWVFRLAAGECLTGEVIQEGVDVEVRVTGPQGLLPSIDSRVIRGPEAVRLCAKAGGEYRVEIDGMGFPGTYRFEAKVVPRPGLPRLREADAMASLHRARALAKGNDQNKEAAFALFLDVEAQWGALREGARQGDALERAAELLEDKPERAQERLRLREKALKLFEGGNDIAARVRQWNGIGACQRDLKNSELQMAAFETARKLAMDWGDPRGYAAALVNQGYYWRAQGQPLRALLMFEDALGDWERLGETLEAGKALLAEGSIHASYGDLDKALELYGQAAKKIVPQGDLRQRALLSLAIANAYRQQGRSDEAKAEANRALGLWHGLEDARGQATTLTTLSLIYEALGDHRRAITALDQAIAIFRDKKLEDEATVATLNKGILLTRQNEISRSVPLLEKARSEGSRRKIPGVEAVALHALAEALKTTDPGRAIQYAESAIERMETERSQAVLEDLKAAYLEAKKGCYELLVDLLLAAGPEKTPPGKIARAFEMVDLQKSRNLLDSLTGPRRRMALEERLERETIQADLTKISAEMERFPRGSKRWWTLKAIRDQSLDRLAQLDASFALPLKPFVSPRVTLRDLQSKLDGDSLLLVYDLAPLRSYLFVVSRDSVDVRILPPKEEIEGLAAALQGSLGEGASPKNRNKSDELADELGSRILDPAAGLLGTKTLVIIPDGALQLVPFSFLTVASGPGSRVRLFERHDSSLLPSASVLEALERRRLGRSAPLGDIIFFAAPELEPGRNSLLDSQHEVELIRRIVEPLGVVVRPKISFDATKELAVSGILRNFQIAHFATHAEIDNEDPQLSRIVLTQRNFRGDSLDGYLNAYDIWTLDIPADLVVLSACETAQKGAHGGEGLLGLTQAFFHAGASSVLVSLWDVDDEATPYFMERFYKALYVERRSPAAALRQAQLFMSHHERWSSPYYWAGFELQGDWR